jgi:hypothetical protein
MTRDDLRLRRWFSEYVSRFYNDDPDFNSVIRVKEEHTYRVCEETDYLARNLNLSLDSLKIAQTAALFHDLGRFKQYLKYRTFKDSASENHGKLSIRELGRHKVLLHLTAREKRIVATAVAYHNALHIPQGLDSDRLFHLLLLRDADKLDIWRLITENLGPRGEKMRDEITVHIPAAPGCSPAVISDLRCGELVDFSKVKTFDDYKLLTIGWVYDLNFAPAFQRLKEGGYIERIEESLPDDEAVRSAVACARNYAARMRNQPAFDRSKPKSQSGKLKKNQFPATHSR